MWHKPHLMTAIADLLFLAGAAALLVAAVIWGAPRWRLFPVNEVRVLDELHEVRREEIEQTLATLLRGNFVTVNIDALRQALEQLPWVRRAEVWRRWPSRVEIRIEEQRAAAYWGNGKDRLVNSYGEVFAATLPRETTLPKLGGPAGTSADVLLRHEEFSKILQPIGHRPVQVALSPRLAWMLKLEDGLLIELGREQAKAPVRTRLQRFVDHYPAVSNRPNGPPLVVDMRYPNGFALRFPPGTVQ
ncbi:MAG TPA: cell division protein FtsQ/DivIB, partial [Accumulibacter sp.]|nr:cell division protein FtsQ/DivIB [Accumulibacter sp.]